MEIILNIISCIFLVVGSFFCVTGVTGLLRFPDFFSRLHATSITDTLGAGSILIGLMLQSGWSLNLGKLIIILLFSLLASATASHAMAKAALKTGMKPLLMNSEDEKSGEMPSQR